MTDLSPQQNEALQRIRAWYQDQDDWSAEPFRLYGPAGTGKTTLAREVAGAIGAIGDVLFAAYTGKAASVLRQKGCVPASTLHSLVYKPVSNREARRRLIQAEVELQAKRPTLADLTPADGAYESAKEEVEALEAEIQELEKQVATIGWEWNPDSPLADAGLLILDEVSMVDAKLAGDIERFGVPVLVLGDPEQLEPVGGEGYYTTSAPDYMLTEIHRQALDSPVLQLATRVRTSSDRRLGLTAEDFTAHDVRLAMEHDQVLVWKNATRWVAISKIRGLLGRQPGVVVAGDRVMCLTNNRDLGVFNGQQFEVLDSVQGPLGPQMTVRDDSGAERTILAFQDGFNGREYQDMAKRRNDGGKGNRMLATFANAITVHKAQGSEWGSVYVVNESQALLGMTASRKGEAEGIQSARRWLYTAATRASERLTITRPKG
jgi:exodeoxyribonuclease V